MFSKVSQLKFVLMPKSILPFALNAFVKQFLLLFSSPKQLALSHSYSLQNCAHPILIVVVLVVVLHSNVLTICTHELCQQIVLIECTHSDCTHCGCTHCDCTHSDCTDIYSNHQMYSYFRSQLLLFTYVLIVLFINVLKFSLFYFAILSPNSIHTFFSQAYPQSCTNCSHSFIDKFLLFLFSHVFIAQLSLVLIILLSRNSLLSHVHSFIALLSSMYSQLIVHLYSFKSIHSFIHSMQSCIQSIHNLRAQFTFHSKYHCAYESI